MSEGILMTSLAEGRSPARKVSRREHRARLHCQQCPLRRGDPDVHGVEGIGHLVQLHGCDPPKDRWPRYLRMGEADHDEQPGVVVGYAHLLCCIDDVLPGRATGSSPPAAMSNRHERTQCEI